MDSLLNVYKSTLAETKGYLTENGTINTNRLLTFLKKVGEKDQYGKIFRHQYDKEKLNDNEVPLRKFSIKGTTDYVQGLCWIFQYYYQGPPSWNWYYPYYYAPLAYDFSNLTNVPLNFDQNTKPFSPFEQMIATFSPENVKYLPPKWQPLMLEENSPIIEFYPKNFYIDPNGKQNSSQYVALLPFVDEERLLGALQLVYSDLTPEEEQRNRRDYDRLFIHSQNLHYEKFKKLCGNSEKKITENNSIQIQSISNGRLRGDVWPVDNDKTIDIEEDEKDPLSNCTNTSNNEVICFKYRDPLFGIASSGKDINNRFHLQTASSHSNSALAEQTQQQQALSSNQASKRFSRGKPSKAHHN